MPTPRRTTAPRYIVPWATPTRAPLYTRPEASLEIEINKPPTTPMPATETIIRPDLPYPFPVALHHAIPRSRRNIGTGERHSLAAELEAWRAEAPRAGSWSWS